MQSGAGRILSRRPPLGNCNRQGKRKENRVRQGVPEGECLIHGKLENCRSSSDIWEHNLIYAHSVHWRLICGSSAVSAFEIPNPTVS